MCSEQKFYNTQEFKALNKEWQQKLEDSQFNDIEDSDNKDLPLHKDIRKKESNRYFTREASEEYYTMVTHYLYSGVFDSARQKSIFALHCEAIPYKEIGKQVGVSKATAHFQVKKVLSRIKRGI